MAMTLVSTVTIGSGGSSFVLFSNIPQTGKDLVLLVSSRSTDTQISEPMYIGFNSNSSNFSGRYLFGNGSTVSSGTDAREAGNYAGANSTSNTFSNVQIYVSNYASSAAKSFAVESTSENNATSANHYISAKLWNNTSAITSLSLDTGAGVFVQYTTFSLYIIS